MSTDLQLRWYADNIELAGALCVDVGANVGEVSQFFFDHGDANTRVLSIEPVTANVDALRKRVDAAGSPRWEIKRGAISDAPGRITLQTQHDKHGWNAMVCANPPPTAHLEVDAWRLPELAPQANVVKLDVEGHEYAILDDALSQMPAVHTWAVELHLVEGRPLPRVLTQFADAGFELLAATARRSDPTGAWHSAALPAALTWAAVPVARRRSDGREFKMLHILARRR